MLLGQNVNSYGHDFKNGDTFAKLLSEICKVDGDFIVRFVSPHPRDFTDDVIEVIAKEEKIAKCLHLDRKSTRLNSSHANISYAVFCLKKKKKCIALYIYASTVF